MKSDVRHRSRLVALGYRQLYGVDYQDVHAPVLHEVSFRIILLTKMIRRCTIRKIDVEATFMEGRLEEDIFIKFPEGWSEIEATRKDDVGKLNAVLYGLKQAARKFYRKLHNFLTQKLNFTRWGSDPCLMSNNHFLIGIYVDDILIVSEIEDINRAEADMKEDFCNKKSEQVIEFLGVEISWNEDKN